MFAGKCLPKLLYPLLKRILRLVMRIMHCLVLLLVLNRLSLSRLLMTDCLFRRLDPVKLVPMKLGQVMVNKMRTKVKRMRTLLPIVFQRLLRRLCFPLGSEWIWNILVFRWKMQCPNIVCLTFRVSTNLSLCPRWRPNTSLKMR